MALVQRLGPVPAALRRAWGSRASFPAPHALVHFTHMRELEAKATKDVERNLSRDLVQEEEQLMEEKKKKKDDKKKKEAAQKKVVYDKFC